MAIFIEDIEPEVPDDYRPFPEEEEDNRDELLDNG